MPSRSLQRWSAERLLLLDDIENAHRAVRGSGAGAKAATQQINRAYALQLSAQFQAYCRDLHSECAEYYIASVVDPGLNEMLLLNLVFGRKIDRGNPNPGNIGSDFSRFVPSFWTLVDAYRPQNPNRKMALDELNKWRNAIAHQDFDATMLKAGRPNLTLVLVQSWRKVCDGLARSFDDIVWTDVKGRTGIAPW